MPFIRLSKEDFCSHLATATNSSFLQSLEMADLLTRRGFTVDYIGYKDTKVSISALIYSKPMTGGLYMEINGGPVVTNPAHLTAFYQGLIAYAKHHKALELVVKPYDTYQTFDSHGHATDTERQELIDQLKHIGFHHHGLTTGYPNGEPTWHYLKELSGWTADTVSKTFTKKGQALLTKMHTFGIQLRRLDRQELPIFKTITASTSDRRHYLDKPLEYYQDFYDAFGDQAEFMVAEISFDTYRTNLLQRQEAVKLTIDRIKADLDKHPTSQKKQNQLREYSSQYNTFTNRLTEAQHLIDVYGKDPVVLAGSLFVYTPQEAVYLFSGSYTEFNAFYAPIALQEHAMREAVKRQIPIYNLLGIQGVFDQSDGVLRFKQNFNGYIVRKAGTFSYYPSPLKYRLIQLLKKCIRRH